MTFDLRSILCAVLAMTACGDNTSWDSAIAAEAAAGAQTVEVSLGEGASTRAEASVIASIPPTADVSPRPPGARVARGPGGTYIITGTYRTAAYTVHGSAGELLEIVNREGSGPGEYKYPEWAVTRRDSVFVFDKGNARVAVLDSSHTHARYFSRPAIFIRSLAARDGVFFAHTPPPSGLDGFEFKLFDDRGRITAEFGDSTGERSSTRRAVTFGADGDIWSAYYDQYVLQQFERTGKLIRSLYVRRPWFEPWREWRELSPAVIDIASDSRGLLWVLVAKPVEGWQRPAPRMSSDGVHIAATDSNDMDAGYDFVVDVIDPAQERIISSVDLPNGYFQGFIEPGVLYSFRNDEDWLIHVDIWRIQQVPLN